MEVTVKTLAGDVFKISAENANTVADLKQKVFEAKNFPVEKQKLICSGKILSDDAATVESLALTSDSFLVCMVSKGRKKKKKKKKKVEVSPAPSASSSNTSSAAAPTPAATPAKSDAMDTDDTPTATPADQTTSSGSTPGAPTKAAEDASANTTRSTPAAPSLGGGASEAHIATLKAMGFQEDQIRPALRAAFNDPNRAVQYLTSGIPAHLVAMSMGGGGGGTTTPAPATTTTTPTPGTATTTTTTTTPAAKTATEDDPLAVIRNDPAFQEMKRMVQADRSKLPVILQQIGEQRPELFRVINANRAKFLEMLNEPIADTPSPGTTPGTAPATGGMPSIPGMMPGSGGMPGMNAAMLAQMIQGMSPEQRSQMLQQLGMTPAQLQQFTQAISSMPPAMLQQLLARGMGGGGGGMPPPGAHVVRLTEEEAAAVQRLQDLGFTRRQAIEAYLACDKNEQMAANLLFDGSFN